MPQVCNLHLKYLFSWWAMFIFINKLCQKKENLFKFWKNIVKVKKIRAHFVKKLFFIKCNLIIENYNSKLCMMLPC